MENRKEHGKNTSRVGGERRADDVVRIADALKRHGRITLCVHGTSMQPWVRPKDIALIRQTSIENVRCGDVVLFRRENQLFVHRIVEKRGSLHAAQLFSKGDAQDRKSTRLNSSHLGISYAVFCLKKKNITT